MLGGCPGILWHSKVPMPPCASSVNPKSNQKITKKFMPVQEKTFLLYNNTLLCVATTLALQSRGLGCPTTPFTKGTLHRRRQLIGAATRDGRAVLVRTLKFCVWLFQLCHGFCLRSASSKYTYTYLYVDIYMYIYVISLSCILESNHGVTYGPEGKYSIRVQQFHECINSGWVRAVRLSECRCFNRFQGLAWHRTHTLHIKCMCYIC